MGVPPACLRLERTPRTLLALSLLFASLVLSTPFAQSAPPPTTTAPSATKDKPASLLPKDAKGGILQSRYVAESEIDTYVASLASVISMRGRATDPFGQLQDPNAKPIPKATAPKTIRRAAPVQATPFSDIIRLIKVTTIMPKDKRFLVGTRSIKQGDRIPLAYRGKRIQVEVSAVSSKQIDFRNIDNNETASLKLNVLPTGMSRGTGGITAPGMIPDRPNSPLELDSGTHLNDNSPNHNP